jgi:hypothetical protein
MLFAVIFIAGSLALPVAARASIPFFGPIVPEAINRCAAGWAALITVINDIIELLITLAIVFVAPITIAYAGFLLVTSQGNSGAITKAKGVIENTVVGIIIAIAAWLIVDAVMSVLYHPSDSTWGTWSSLIYGNANEMCLVQEGSLQTLNQTNLNVTGITANGNGVSVSGKSGQLCSDANTACSPASLQSVGFNSAQANAMSCIAMTESSGIPSTPPYNTTHPDSNSTACGTFQITQSTWNKAASGACSNFSNCQNAACNMQVAQTLVSQSGYSSWTCANCNSKATSCVQQYKQYGGS